MVKKYSFFVNLPEVLYLIFYPFFPSIYYFVNVIMLDDSNLALSLMLLWLVAYCLGFFRFGHKSYLRLWMTSEKIYNRHLSFRWEEITEYRVLEYTWFDYGFLSFLKNIPFKAPCQDILCIGETKGLKFKAQSTKKCIMINLSKRNLQKIKEMNCNKSPAINELLSLYLREGNH